MRKVVAPALLLLAGCAVRLGGPGPVEYDTVAIHFDASVTAAQAAAQLRELGTEIALISTPRDSAWVREAAQQAQLIATRPGRANDLTLAFLHGKPEGDTTLTLPAGNGRLRMHDALYKIDKYRWLDLMTVVVESGTNAREAVRALLNYIATDVKSDAVTALAIHAPTPAVGDSIADLTRAVWADVSECTEAGRRGEKPKDARLRLFYFPGARVDCTQARVLSSGLAAKLVIAR